MANDLTRRAYRTRLGNLTAKSVLGLLCDAAGPDGLAWPSIDYIVRGTEINRRTVLRMVEVFAAMSLVALMEVERKGKMLPAMQINLAMLGDDSRVSDLTEEFIRAYAGAQGKVAEKIRPGKWRLRDATPDVSETQGASQRRKPRLRDAKRVSETLPPHPLIGGTVRNLFEPQEPETQEPETREQGKGKAEDAASELDPGQQEHLDRLAAEGRETEKWRCHYLEQNQKAFEAARAMRAEEEALRAEYPDLETALLKVGRKCGWVWVGTGKQAELELVMRRAFADQAEMGKPVWRTASQMVEAWLLQRKQGKRLRARFGPVMFIAGGHWLDPDGWHWNVEELNRQAGAGVGSR